MLCEDSEWRDALKWRAALPGMARGAQCGLWLKSNHEPCGKCMDPFGDHVMTCNYGPWRHQRHDAGADMLVGPCEAAAAAVLR